METVFSVRYYECDMQRVVHNAVYLAWCDDVGDRLFRAAGLGPGSFDWDVMVKTATVTWSGPARLGDEVVVRAAPVRWGRTSFDVGYEGAVRGQAIFEATITYVAVDMDRGEPVAVPEEFRAAVSEA